MFSSLPSLAEPQGGFRAIPGESNGQFIPLFRPPECTSHSFFQRDPLRTRRSRTKRCRMDPCPKARLEHCQIPWDLLPALSQEERIPCSSPLPGPAAPSPASPGCYSSLPEVFFQQHKSTSRCLPSPRPSRPAVAGRRDPSRQENNGNGFSSPPAPARAGFVCRAGPGPGSPSRLDLHPRPRLPCGLSLKRDLNPKGSAGRELRFSFGALGEPGNIPRGERELPALGSMVPAGFPSPRDSVIP